MNMKSLFKIALLTLLTAALSGLPLQVLAQSTNKPAAKSGTEIKQGKKAHPFHGKLVAVDKMAKTITVGKSTYQITSETKIMKAGKPATLSDGVVGEEVSGYLKPDEAGKLVASSLTFGPKPDAKSSEKKSSSSDKTQKQ